MKKKHAIYLAIALAVIGGTLAFRLWPRTVPPEQTSELYVRYHGTPGVDATFIRGFRVNDTLTLDVTLLQATDSAGWETLITDFQVTREFINLKFDNIISRWGKKGHADKQQDSIPENNDLILVANRMRAISIFHITDKSQFKQIIRIHVKELKDKYLY